MNKVIKIIAILAILIFAVYWGKTIILRMLYKTDYRQYVEKYAEKYGVEKELLYAVIKVESKFDPNAISKSKAKGLMQIMDSTAKEIAKKNNYIQTDDIIVIAGGASVLSGYHKDKLNKTIGGVLKV